jgi:hypothetical protein
MHSPAHASAHSVRRAVGCGILAALTVLPGCYTYVPVASTTPPTGETVAFEISDQGRVGLGDRMGASVDRIEGRVKAAEGDRYLVEVYRVSQISNGKSEWSQWSGETMQLDRGYVRGYQLRRLSKSRSWLLAGTVTAALVTLALTTSLSALFQGEKEPKEPGEGPSTQRAPAHP